MKVTWKQIKSLKDCPPFFDMPEKKTYTSRNKYSAHIFLNFSSHNYIDIHLKCLLHTGKRYI